MLTLTLLSYLVPGLANVGFLFALLMGLIFLLCAMICTFCCIKFTCLASVLVSPWFPTFVTKHTWTTSVLMGLVCVPATNCALPSNLMLLQGINGSGQVPDITNSFALVDPDTPQSAYHHTSFESQAQWDLVFSDEFNRDNRTFYPVGSIQLSIISSLMECL